MKKTIFLALCCAFSTNFTHAEYQLYKAEPTTTYNKMLLGALQFPKKTALQEGVRVYYNGHKFTGTVKPKTQKISFEIPVTSATKNLYMLVTKPESLQGVTFEGNTIEYYKLAPNAAYKLYALALIKTEFAAEKEALSFNKTKQPVTDHVWEITEQAFTNATKRIPENTLIVCYDHDAIDRLEGGDALHLPTLFIKESEATATKESAHDASLKCLLASLDLDALHSTHQTAVNSDHQRCKLVTVIS